jgi:dihydroorotate dehydrogenase electron transfer subunit
VGKGTYYLSKRKKGEKINCIGPLGKGFHLPKSKIIIIAGGVGIAPLIYLIEKCKMKNVKCKIIAFLGAKTKDEILCAKKLKNLGAEIHIATEDGSLGYKGLVSTLLKDKLSSVVCRLSSVVYACGPKGMLKEVALLSEKHQIPCQVSFEQFMGCGIGICNSCVIRTKQGYKRVCKDGPVFWAEKIDWEKI